MPGICLPPDEDPLVSDCEVMEKDLLPEAEAFSPLEIDIEKGLPPLLGAAPS